MAINTNIEDTKNIKYGEERNLFAIALLLSSLVIAEFRVLFEVLILSIVIIIVTVFLKSIIISYT
ncbi:MAG TPA: hypothetical protein VLA74_15125 [Nitrososphaeraceae archaeon]|nr:hypothetical protein [Nitrososphaeraceae archaeon]